MTLFQFSFKGEVINNAMRTPTLESINRDRRMRGDQEIEVWQAAVAYLIALYARRTLARRRDTDARRRGGVWRARGVRDCHWRHLDAR